MLRMSDPLMRRAYANGTGSEILAMCMATKGGWFSVMEIKA